MKTIAVIDTETNWADQVMSIGTIIADGHTYSPIDLKYHVLPIECAIGGMYEHALFINTPVEPKLSTRAEAIQDLQHWFKLHSVTSMFAYNAAFDRNHLPELRNMQWFDIMRLAAYRQYNSKIPACTDCFSTGRMKRGYGVEPMLQILSGKFTYHETHNAICDAMDELKIMQLLGYSPNQYIPL